MNDCNAQPLDLFPGVVGLMSAIAVVAPRGTAINRGPVHRAVAGRQIEYVAGRVLACEALARIGIDTCDLGVAANRAPAWPLGVVGSISHSMGLVAAAVSHSGRHLGMGIDLEVAGSLAYSPIASLFTVAELTRFQQLDLTLIFSAKEALYKLLNPILGRYIDHLEIEIQMKPAWGEFCALPHVRAHAPTDLTVLLRRVRGRYFKSAGCWVTCAVIAAE